MTKIAITAALLLASSIASATAAPPTPNDHIDCSRVHCAPAIGKNSVPGRVPYGKHVDDNGQIVNDK